MGVYGRRASGVRSCPRRRPATPRGRRPHAVESRSSLQRGGGPLMSQISRRTFLGTAGLTAAGVATGPWVLRAHAQAQTVKIGILYDHTGPVLRRRLAQLLARRQDDHRLCEREGAASSASTRSFRSTVTASPRPRSRSTRPSGSSTWRRWTSSPAFTRAPTRCRWPRRWTSKSASSGSRPPSRRRCSTGRNLQYTFRPQATGIQFGELSVAYIADYSEDKLKKAPKDLRLAIIYEDGAYGRGRGPR